MDPIRAIGSSVPGGGAPAEASASAAGAEGFGEWVGGLLEEADREQQRAEEQARALSAGKADLVETMIAVSRADLALRFVVSLRNRALEAYQEIMRIQF